MKISIITASYNYANYIAETIQSVLNQTYQDWEMLIIDDGSTDNSIEVIQKYCEKDSRIKLYTHENNTNKGLKQTLLLGISKAQSDWIVFLESDDLIKEDYLEKKVAIAQKYPDLGIIFNDVELFGDKERIKFSTPPFTKSHNELIQNSFPRNIFREMNVSNRILTFSTVMVKKSILLPEYFDTPIDKLLDWWLYIHLTYKNEVYYIPEKLTKWRLHKGSYITQNQGTKFHFIQIHAYIDIYNKVKPDIEFLMFIIKTIFLVIFVKTSQLNLYRIMLIRKIKSKLGLKLRESPIF